MKNLSKQAFRPLLLVVLITFLSSCKKNEFQEKVNSLSDDLKVIQSKGFSIKGIIDAGSFYVVEGDIVINKNSISSITNKVRTQEPQKSNQAHVGFGNLVTITTISVFIDQTNLPQVWIDAANNAIASWNVIPNFGLNFIITNNQSQADISILSTSLPAGVIGMGGFPVNGNPGDVSIDLNNAGNASSSFAQQVMAHEIGHTLGFRHTDYFYEGNATRINGTLGSTSFNVNPDLNSVMVSGPNNIGVWSGFSVFDIVGFRQTYPLDVNQIVLNRYRQGSSYFYTQDWSELRDAYQTGWVLENPPGFVFINQVPGTLPIYRYFRSSNVDHLYTMNFNELGNGGQGYVREGNAGFAYTSPVPGTIPLYRFYKNAKHFYTNNYSEGSNNGFTYEGVCAYIIP